MKKRTLPKPISKRALEKEYEELSIQTNYTIDSSTDEGGKTSLKQSIII